MAGLTIKELAEFCARVGIAFPTAESYGGFSGFYDWGPVGAEIKKNVKDAWWRFFVHGMEEVVGIDGSIITHPRVWEASGHVEHFHDPIVACTKCGKKYRADKLLAEVLGVQAEGLSAQELERIIREKGVRCPACGGELGDVTYFNLMFSTQVGPYEGQISYLRPETAQLIFVDFPRVYLNARKRMPLGVAQIGKAFRNEISPRNFLFRLREFEQMEIEFFFDPEDDECPYYRDVREREVLALTAEMQEKREKEKPMVLDELVPDIPGREWMVFWIAKSLEFFEYVGVDAERIRVREQLPDERAHYSMGTWDIEFRFDDMGWQEIEGIAHRGTYDLSRHQEYSGRSFEAVRPDGTKFIPMVIEPSWGVDRTILAILYSAYERGERTVLHLAPHIAPYTVAVFPLVTKEELPKIARELYEKLKEHFPAFYDERGSIGKRYRRQDEIGTPFCVTVDFQTLEDGTVTIRDRDSMEQVRVRMEEVVDWIREHVRSWRASRRR